jgi:hypothetical protein
MFFYNIYIEKKIILPIFYLNDISVENDNEKNIIKFDSLFTKYNVEIFNDNHINLIYNTYIFDIKNNNILIYYLI